MKCQLIVITDPRQPTRGPRRRDSRYSGKPVADPPGSPFPPSAACLVEYARLSPLALTFLSNAEVLFVLCTQHLAKTEEADPQEALMTLDAA